MGRLEGGGATGGETEGETEEGGGVGEEGFVPRSSTGAGFCRDGRRKSRAIPNSEDSFSFSEEVVGGVECV